MTKERRVPQRQRHTAHCGPHQHATDAESSQTWKTSVNIEYIPIEK